MKWIFRSCVLYFVDLLSEVLQLLCKEAETGCWFPSLSAGVTSGHRAASHMSNVNKHKSVNSPKSDRPRSAGQTQKTNCQWTQHVTVGAERSGTEGEREPGRGALIPGNGCWPLRSDTSHAWGWCHLSLSLTQTHAHEHLPEEPVKMSMSFIACNRSFKKHKLCRRVRWLSSHKCSPLFGKIFCSRPFCSDTVSSSEAAAALGDRSLWLRVKHTWKHWTMKSELHCAECFRIGPGRDWLVQDVEIPSTSSRLVSDGNPPAPRYLLAASPGHVVFSTHLNIQHLTSNKQEDYFLNQTTMCSEYANIYASI